MFKRIYHLIAFRNLFLVLLSFAFMGQSFSQQLEISVGNGKIYADYDRGLDYLIVMNEITSTTEISVILPAATLSHEWYRYPDFFLSNQNFINPDDHTGYVLKIEGTLNGQVYHKELSIWVIDYSLYVPLWTAIKFPEPDMTTCESLSLELDGTIPDLYYKTPDNSEYPIQRVFNLQYESLEFEDGEWRNLSIETPITIEDSIILVNNPPLKDTEFTLIGDQFAEDLGLAKFELKSDIYSAIRVAVKIKTETEVRTEKNEGDRPESATVLSGSAPLIVDFNVVTNGNVADYFKWEISTDGFPPFLVRNGISHTYTFQEAGTFLVILKANNSYCNDMDSVLIKVSESAVYAPNVFTPNGDGINDEFRVAYKSINEFNCWIYNRWGQEIYHWTDPQKGWDGTYKGKPVAEGPYFYVIRAKGADGIDYKLKGDITLLRGKDN